MLAPQKDVGRLHSLPILLNASRPHPQLPIFQPPPTSIRSLPSPPTAIPKREETNVHTKPRRNQPSQRATLHRTQNRGWQKAIFPERPPARTHRPNRRHAHRGPRSLPAPSELFHRRIPSPRRNRSASRPSPG